LGWTRAWHRDDGLDDRIGDLHLIPGLVSGLGAEDGLDAGGHLHVELPTVLARRDLDVDLVGLDDQRLRRLLLHAAEAVW